jgi:hypothetical protein
VPSQAVPLRDFRKSWAAACEKAKVPGRLFHDDVAVPPEHGKDGRVGPPLPATMQKPSGFRAASGKDRPSEVYAAVKYEDHWFWIDDRDFASKRALSFMMVLLALSETGGGRPGRSSPDDLDGTVGFSFG